jgi:hypothetical protein
MTKEQLAVVGLIVTIVGLLVGLFGSTFHFGTQIGTLTTQVAQQTEEIRLLKADLRAINAHFIQWAGRHEVAARERTGP